MLEYVRLAGVVGVCWVAGVCQAVVGSVGMLLACSGWLSLMGSVGGACWGLDGVCFFGLAVSVGLVVVC